MNGTYSKRETLEIRNFLFNNKQGKVGEIAPIDEESLKIEFVTTNGVPYKETIYTLNKGFSGGKIPTELHDELATLLEKLL